MIILSFLHVALIAFIVEYFRRNVFTIQALFKKTPGFLPAEIK